MNTLFSSVNNSMSRHIPTVSTTPTLTTLAGTTQGFSGDNGNPTSAQLYNPNGIAVSNNGNVYICDTSNTRIRKINYFTNTISTIAGSSTNSTTGDGGAATSATLGNPFNIICDPYENLFISQGDNKIRLINYSTGIISTIISLSQGYSLTYYNGRLYIGNTSSTILQITNTGTLFSTYTTSSISGFSTAIGIAFDSVGNMFVANYGANNIIKCSGGFSGSQSTVISPGAGTLPLGLCFNANDDLFVSLQSGNVVRKYTKASSYGSYTTLISGLSGPWNMCMACDGSLYVTDAGNNKIKKYTNA